MGFSEVELADGITLFWEEFSQAKVERPWFAVVAEARKVYAYESYPVKWYTLPEIFSHPNSVILATSKGLCLSRLSRRASDLHDLLLVHDPLTGSERILPPQTLFDCGYAMAVDLPTKVYTVYHFGQLESFLDGVVANQHTFEAWSSDTNAWQVLSHVNQEMFFGLPSYAFEEAKLLVWEYVICRLRGYFGLFAYSLMRREWLQIP